MLRPELQECAVQQKDCKDAAVFLLNKYGYASMDQVKQQVRKVLKVPTGTKAKQAVGHVRYISKDGREGERQASKDSCLVSAMSTLLVLPKCSPLVPAMCATNALSSTYPFSFTHFFASLSRLYF